MPDEAPRTVLKDLTHEELQAWFQDQGEKRFRADQVFRWIHGRGVRRIADMTDLSRPLRERLETDADIGGLRLTEVLDDPDGTRKLLFRTWDDCAIESVIIPMDVGTTLCVSSQVGCNLGCRFCLTGTRRKTRNLTPGEIVDQVTHAAAVLTETTDRALPNLAVGDERERGRAVGNIVFMGMGEPLDNYDNVVRSIRMLAHPLGLDFSSRRITVSTCGLVPAIERLGAEPGLTVNLAVSLNGTTDEQRGAVMPIGRRYGLEELFGALRRFPVPRRRRITFGYVMLAGVNDSLEDARRLVGLVHGLRCKVNLLAFNPWDGAPYERPSQQTVVAFKERLKRSGVTATVRESRGREIGAACGQLGGRDVSLRPDESEPQ